MDPQTKTVDGFIDDIYRDHLERKGIPGHSYGTEWILNDGRKRYDIGSRAMEKLNRPAGLRF